MIFLRKKNSNPVQNTWAFWHMCLYDNNLNFELLANCRSNLESSYRVWYIIKKTYIQTRYQISSLEA